MGIPGYRLQVGDAYLEDNQVPVIDPATGLPIVDPATENRSLFATPGRRPQQRPLPPPNSHFLLAGDFDRFQEPTTYLRADTLRQRRHVRQQVLTNWNGYQLLGIQPISGTDFDISLTTSASEASATGPRLPIAARGRFGIPGQVAGLLDYWGIKDEGLDDLGEGRMDLQPAKEYRYRLFGQHRQLLPYDLQSAAQTLWVSDRNFMEQYYEREWDEVLLENPNSIELKQIRDNWSGHCRRCPTESVLHPDRVVSASTTFCSASRSWATGSPGTSVSTVGYAQFKTAEPPEDPRSAVHLSP